MAEKFLITGPESSGKTTLSLALAKHFGGHVREEYARTYLEQHGPEYSATDLELIWEGQIKNEKTLDEENKLSFCDTAHFVMAVWNEVKFMYPTLALDQLISKFPLSYKHVFLCAPDLEWAPDPLRESPEKDFRQQLFNRYQALIQEHALPFTVIAGDNRLEQACLVMERLGVKPI